MNNPVIAEIIVEVWNKVAEDVTAGTIQRCSSDKSHSPLSYLQTYRKTGASAPISKVEGCLMFNDSKDTETETIRATEGIDVYVMALGSTGELRVNI